MRKTVGGILMANRYLIPVYSYIFDEPFSYSSFDMRLKMQKVVYLLQEMGVPISDYGFSWYKHGPYSQSLLDDAHNARSNESVPDLSSLSSDNRLAMEKLKHILTVPENTAYSLADWCECVASIHYLRQNVLPRSCKDDDILTTLVCKKAHLKDNMANEEALARVKALFS